jgi:hypothetical protein
MRFLRNLKKKNSPEKLAIAAPIRKKLSTD